MPLPSMMPGTIRKPPPMPKKPETVPTMQSDQHKADRDRRRHAARPDRPPRLRGRNIATPTAIMASANRNSSC